MTKRFYLVMCLLVTISLSSIAQIVNVSPAVLREVSENVVITYHADQGNRQLMGYTGNVYAHIGVITNRSTSSSDWRYASIWGENIEKYKMSYVGTNTWTLNIGDIRKFFNISEMSEYVKQIALVFRSADGLLEGKTSSNGDIFITLNTDVRASVGATSMVYSQEEKNDVNTILLPGTIVNDVYEVCGIEQISLVWDDFKYHTEFKCSILPLEDVGEIEYVYSNTKYNIGEIIDGSEVIARSSAFNLPYTPTSNSIDCQYNYWVYFTEDGGYVTNAVYQEGTNGSDIDTSVNKPCNGYFYKYCVLKPTEKNSSIKFHMNVEGGYAAVGWHLTSEGGIWHDSFSSQCADAVSSVIIDNNSYKYSGRNLKDYGESLDKEHNIEVTFSNDVTDISSIFGNCYNIDYLDMSRFDASKVCDIEEFILGAVALKTLILPSNIDLSIIKKPGTITSLDNTALENVYCPTSRYEEYLSLFSNDTRLLQALKADNTYYEIHDDNTGNDEDILEDILPSENDTIIYLTKELSYSQETKNVISNVINLPGTSVNDGYIVCGIEQTELIWGNFNYISTFEYALIPEGQKKNIEYIYSNTKYQLGELINGKKIIARSSAFNLPYTPSSTSTNCQYNYWTYFTTDGGIVENVVYQENTSGSDINTGIYIPENGYYYKYCVLKEQGTVTQIPSDNYIILHTNTNGGYAAIGWHLTSELIVNDEYDRHADSYSSIMIDNVSYPYNGHSLTDYSCGLNTEHNIVLKYSSTLKDINNYFVNCYNIDFINMSHFDASNVTDMSKLILGAVALKTIVLPANINSNNLSAPVLTSLDNTALVDVFCPSSKYEEYKALFCNDTRLINALKINDSYYESNTDASHTANTNYIFAENCVAKRGGQKKVSVKMVNNIDNISSYQFNVMLPKGITIAKDPADTDFYMVELSTERTNVKKHNTFDATLQTDGTVLVICASTSNAVFSGNDGEICTMVLDVSSDMAPGEYNMNLLNIVMADVDGRVYKKDIVQTVLQVEDSLIGDANHDGDINVGDYNTIVRNLLDSSSGFDKTMDVNQDGEINVGDLNSIVNLILKK